MDEVTAECDYFLLVTGRTSYALALSSKRFLHDVLAGLPSQIGMTTIRAPIVTKATNNPGLEGYVPIDESNITISTYAKDSRFVACVHSCREFSSATVIEYLGKCFMADAIAYHEIREAEFRAWLGPAEAHGLDPQQGLSMRPDQFGRHCLQSRIRKV